MAPCPGGLVVRGTGVAGLSARGGANLRDPRIEFQPARQQLRLNEDFRDLLRALLDAQAQFLVVGAYAVAVHGSARATGDLDVWVAAEPDNAARVWRALIAFGAPVESLGVRMEDLATEGMVVQIGLAPRRVDVLTSLTGVTFREAWEERVEHEVDGLTVPFLGRATLLKNKRAVGRPQDLADVDALEGGSTGKKGRPKR